MVSASGQTRKWKPCSESSSALSSDSGILGMGLVSMSVGPGAQGAALMTWPRSGRMRLTVLSLTREGETQQNRLLIYARLRPSWPEWRGKGDQDDCD